MSLFRPTPAKVEKWVSSRNVAKLISNLKSSDALIRRMCAEGLGQIGGPEVLDYCKENAKHHEQQVRWHVTQILGMIGTPEAMKILGSVKAPGDFDPREHSHNNTK